MRPLGNLLFVLLAIALTPVGALAQSQTRPGPHSPTYNSKLQIGPVLGLTTAWHSAPTHTAVPLGTTIRFRVQGKGARSVEWTGARKVVWRGTATAECHLDTPGPHTVTMTYTDSGGERRQESSHLNVLDTSAFSITVSTPRLWADSVSLNEGTPNETTMRYFFGDSIAAVRQIGEGRYLTSTDRWFHLEAHVEPSAFAPLLEWRLDGKAQEHLGTAVQMQVFPPRIHTIEVGPANSSPAISLVTYMTHITSHETRTSDIPEHSPVTLTARTDPPGYEDEITWLASTKYGSCDPLMGRGREFTVSFGDTFGEEGRWLGVRADNAVVSLDEKCFEGDLDEDGICDDEDNCVAVANRLQEDLDLDGVGDPCDNCPTEQNLDQADGNGDGGGDACEPSPVFGLCGDAFTPAPGIAQELLSPDFPHPLMGGVVHPVLQLSSSLMEGQRETLAEMGVELHEAISRNAFLVAIHQDRLAEAAELPFVRAFFPLPPGCRKGLEPETGGVMQECPIIPGLKGDVPLCPVVEVLFHQDVPDEVAEDVLSIPSAIVLQRGVTIGGATVGGRRVNSWQAIVLPSRIDELSQEEPVVHVQFVGDVEDQNDGSRAAVGGDLAQAPPWCGGGGCSGSGIVFSQWETRWANGDLMPTPPPPALPAGAGTHAALMNRVVVRDLPMLDPADPLPPAGCAGTIGCNLCTFSNHAAHVAGTMLGDGTANATMIGMSPGATNISYNLPLSVAELACELTDSNQGFDARLANNSWGASANCATQGRYDTFSQGYDQQIRALPAEAVIFSAGNCQRLRNGDPFCAIALPCLLPAIYSAPSTSGSCTTPPPGVVVPPAAEPAPLVRNRFFSLSAGRGQSAKNTTVVGAINSGAPSAPATLGRMTTFSAWGPTQDGRIKPDLVTAGAENNTRDGTAGDPDPGITSTICVSDPAGNCVSVDDAYGGLRGTSMAAPALTGAAGLILQQQGVTGLVVGDTPLDSDSLKALLVHTATDLSAHFPLGGAFMNLQNCGGTGTDCWPVPAVAPGTVQDGPDYVNGWGLVNVPAALAKVISGNPELILRPTSCPTSVTFPQLPFNSPLAVGGDPTSIGVTGCSTAAIWDWVGYINVPPGTTQLKVTIAWDDPPSPPPGAGSTAPLLVHDLDLIVTPGTGMGNSFTPTGPHNYSWFLDPACPYLQAVPVSSTDFSPSIFSDQRNNVEQVVIDSPAAGQWRVVVQSIGLSEQQPFAILISMPPSVP